MQSYLNLFSLFLLGLLFPIYSTAQIGELEVVDQNGNIKKYNIDVTQFTKEVTSKMDVHPALMLVNSQKVSVALDLQKDFLKLTEKESDLQKYRRLLNTCEANPFLIANQSTEHLMSGRRVDIDAYGYISQMLEKKLRHGLQNYFSTPLCFAYNLELKDETEMKKVGPLFNVEWLIEPSILSIESKENLVKCQLQLKIWDVRNDTLLKNIVLESAGLNVKTAIAELLNKSETYILGQIFRDKKFREKVKLNKSRLASFKQIMSDPKDSLWVGEIMRSKYYGNYLGALANPEKTKFIAFNLTPFIPDFKDKIENHFAKNPYPKINLDDDKDPMRMQFRGTTVLGFYINGKWQTFPVQEDLIYSGEIEKAKDIYFSSFANLDLYKQQSPVVKDDFWNSSFLESADTSDMVYDPPKSFSKYYKNQFQIDKSNLANFQGYPKYILPDLMNKYIEESTQWKRKMTEQFLRSLISKKSLRKKLNLESINTSMGYFHMFHDFERSQAIIPVWVNEIDGQTSLVYFYWNIKEPEAIYHWDHFPKISHFYVGPLLRYPPESGRPLRTDFLAQMNSLTPFKFTLLALDKEFWAKHVLKKEGDNFKYLKKLGE